MRMLAIGSLFSGIGGIELGLESTGGFRTIWFSENDAYASVVLDRHWPGVVNHGDITKINWEEVERPDVLAGGFPCQDISTAGKGKGIKEGTRSGLWFEFLKAICALRPRYVIVENVSAIATRGLDTVLAGLAEEGYDAEWLTIRASDVRAPHRRERLFIIAHTNAGRKECELQAGRASVEGNIDAPNSNRHARFKRLPAKQVQRFPDFSWCEGIRRVEDLFNRPDIPEPLVRGGPDGIPNRVDRTRCLGNAVVPQVAAEVGKRLLKIVLEKESSKH